MKRGRSFNPYYTTGGGCCDTCGEPGVGSCVRCGQDWCDECLGTNFWGVYCGYADCSDPIGCNHCMIDGYCVHVISCPDHKKEQQKFKVRCAVCHEGFCRKEKCEKSIGDKKRVCAACDELPKRRSERNK